MKVEIKIDEVRNFFALIHNLSKDSNPQKYDVTDVFKNYTIPSEIRKEIRKIIACKEVNILSKIKKIPILDLIYENNKSQWATYWKKNNLFVREISENLNYLIKNYDFSSLNSCVRFFNSNMPKKITFYLCAGAINFFGKATSVNKSNDLFIMFPRMYNKFTSKTVKQDFEVMIHEIVHAIQGNSYYLEDKNFIEAVTRAFAPRGILINKENVDKTRIEYKMMLLIEQAIQEKKTFKDIKKELQEIYKSNTNRKT